MDLKVRFIEGKPPDSQCDILRQARRTKGYTQSYVAECLGMSVRQYIKYEKGELDIQNLSFEQGIHLCELLHLEIYQFITPLEELINQQYKKA